MERLTEYTRFHGSMLPVLNNGDRHAAIERLALIEDILGNNYDLSRLRELVQADKDERCVVLPCKARDTVYSAFPLCGVSSHQIRKIEIDADGSFACSALMIPFSDFDKTVFLTRAEAEAALKERQKDES